MQGGFKASMGTSMELYSLFISSSMTVSTGTHVPQTLLKLGIEFRWTAETIRLTGRATSQTHKSGGILLLCGVWQHFDLSRK